MREKYDVAVSSVCDKAGKDVSHLLSALEFIRAFAAANVDGPAAAVIEAVAAAAMDSAAGTQT